MELHLEIHGSLSEILDVLHTFSFGNPIEAVLESIPSVDHAPHPVECKQEEKIVSGPGKDVSKHDVCPGCHKEFIKEHPFQCYCSKKCYQQKYFKDHYKPSERKAKPAPVKLPEPTADIHNCHQCGKPFTAKRTSQKFCSKKCYMIEWRELHVVKKPISLDTVLPINAERDEKLKKKLQELKNNYPQPSDRPDIQRNLLPVQ